ncbi:MAG: hypothetical protein PHP83_01845 [Clostridia bacterium]|nr:hypothetical protein [Clostridia bacterium]
MKTIDVKLLTKIFQNAKLGSQSIEELLEKVKDEGFKTIVSKQQSNYDFIAKECEMLAKSVDVNLKDNCLLTKTKQATMVGLSTLLDQTTRHLAEMMIQGCTMGIIDIIKNLNDYHCADEEILKLGKQLQTMQEKYVEDLTKYLK